MKHRGYWGPPISRSPVPPSLGSWRSSARRLQPHQHLWGGSDAPLPSVSLSTGRVDSSSTSYFITYCLFTSTVPTTFVRRKGSILNFIGLNVSFSQRWWPIYELDWCTNTNKHTLHLWFPNAFSCVVHFQFQLVVILVLLMWLFILQKSLKKHQTKHKFILCIIMLWWVNSLAAFKIIVFVF